MAVSLQHCYFFLYLLKIKTAYSLLHVVSSRNFLGFIADLKLVISS